MSGTINAVAGVRATLTVLTVPDERIVIDKWRDMAVSNIVATDATEVTIRTRGADPVTLHQLADRRALSARDDDAVNTGKLLRGLDEDDVGPTPPERGRVPLEVALDRNHADRRHARQFTEPPRADAASIRASRRVNLSISGIVAGRYLRRAPRASRIQP